nr:hypothetical protein [Clostridioides difficile]
MDNFLIGVLASLTASLIGYIVCLCIKKVKSHSVQESDLDVELKFSFKFKKISIKLFRTSLYFQIDCSSSCFYYTTNWYRYSKIIYL